MTDNNKLAVPTDEQMRALADFIHADLGYPSDWLGFCFDEARVAMGFTPAEVERRNLADKDNADNRARLIELEKENKALRLSGQEALNACRLYRLAIERLEASHVWRSIDSAPKDGSWILIAWIPPSLPRQFLGSTPEVGYWGGDGFIGAAGGAYQRAGAFAPTHWMPILPADNTEYGE